MAGDWIKMRIDLMDDPTVTLIASAVNLDAYSVIGRLHKLWSWADRHAANGATSGVDPVWVDRYLGKKGFARALIDAKWLSFDEQSRVLSFPNFDRHNGESSKSRCDAALRKRKSRERHLSETNGGSNRVAIPAPFIRAVFKRDNYQCVFCGTQSTPEQEEGKKAILSVDHILPYSRSDGRQAIEDLATCCRACNGEKSDRTPEEWGMIPGEFLQPGLCYEGHKIVTTSSDNSVTIDGQKPLPEKRREEYIHTYTREGGLPDSLNTPEMKAAWDSWLVHWSTSFANGRPMPEQTAHAQLRELVAMGPARAVAAIKNSITKGGLRKPFEPFDGKDSTNAKSRTASTRSFSQQNDYSGVTAKL